MRYYFSHFDIPTATPPYNEQSKVWPSTIGNFVKPVIEQFPGLKYWFSFYGDYVQFAAYTDRFDDLDAALKAQAEKKGFKQGRPPESTDTLEGDCAREKFVTDPAKDKTKRALLVLDYLHAISALYVDTLVEKEGFWEVERNTDQNNPDGVTFQAFHHMLCNIAQVPTPVWEAQIVGVGYLESRFGLGCIAAERKTNQIVLNRRHDVHF
jgi:hypothetical protein